MPGLGETDRGFGRIRPPGKPLGWMTQAEIYALDPSNLDCDEGVNQDCWGCDQDAADAAMADGWVTVEDADEGATVVQTIAEGKPYAVNQGELIQGETVLRATSGRRRQIVVALNPQGETAAHSPQELPGSYQGYKHISIPKLKGEIDLSAEDPEHTLEAARHDPNTIRKYVPVE